MAAINADERRQENHDCLSALTGVHRRPV